MPRFCALSGLLSALLSAAALVYAGPPVATEQDVKAAYLVNILKLVRPKDAPAAERSELAVCLVNAGAVEPPLRALEGGLIGGRKLKLVTLQKEQEALPCQVVFLGRSAGQQAVITKARSLGLLTIGNDGEFISKSGMIALVVEGRKIVVEVNEESIRSSGWLFSSHLLEIARISRPGGVR